MTNNSPINFKLMHFLLWKKESHQSPNFETAKFEEKLALGSKNDMRNLVYFNTSSGKSENFHFDM